MPRRKNAKRANKTLLARRNLVTIQKLERDLLRSPTKLSRQLKIEVTSLRQKDTRIKKAIAKLDATVQGAKKRLKLAMANRDSVAGKKRVTKAKRTYGNSNKLLTSLNKQLNKNSKLLDMASARHEKILAMKKHLGQFEKDWATKAKQKKKTKASSTQPKRVRKARQTKMKEAFTEAPKYDTFETVTDDVSFKEKAGVTS